MNKYILFFFFAFSSLNAMPTLIKDADNFYSTKTASFLIKSLIPAAIMANSSLDEQINTLYQENIRSSATNKISKVAKICGSNMPLTIAFISGITAGYIFRDSMIGMKIVDYSINTFRGTITGLPLLIGGQNILGADRPSQNINSYWKPFNNDHGVSGHAFMGAVPFITAANMTKNPYLKTLFYISSTAVGLSRINDSQHYASQVLLGWSLAYASCSAVLETNISIKATGNSLSFGYNF